MSSGFAGVVAALIVAITMLFVAAASLPNGGLIAAVVMVGFTGAALAPYIA